MSEKEKKEKKQIIKQLVAKEPRIAAITGLVLGILITCLVVFSIDFFATSSGIAKLKYGEEVAITVNGKGITSQTIYDKTKKTSGLNAMLEEVDKSIINEMYILDEKDEEEVQEIVQSNIDYAATMGYSEEDFLKENGLISHEDFVESVRMSVKTNKYIFDYLESKLEEGAVEKYYNENKSNIETYDSEHLLVKVTDEVTEEQALALANEILDKVNKGTNFEDIVKEYGDKVVHEKLGFQGKSSSLEQAYIDELVALEDGTYSKTPIKTSYGYHIVHKIATATLEDLRESIIETLSKDLISSDEYLIDKIFIELRASKELAIHDEELKKQYEENCNEIYKTKNDTSDTQT